MLIARDGPELDHQPSSAPGTRAQQQPEQRLGLELLAVYAPCRCAETRQRTSCAVTPYAEYRVGQSTSSGERRSGLCSPSAAYTTTSAANKQFLVGAYTQWQAWAAASSPSPTQPTAPSSLKLTIYPAYAASPDWSTLRA